MFRLILPAALVGLAFGAWSAVTPAAALSAKDCSVKYQAAKQAGTLNGQKWNDFRKAECGDAPATATGTRSNPAAPTPANTAAPAPAPATTASKPAQASAPSASTGSATFPGVVDPKYAKESPGKSRMHTCLDSYNAAKAAGTLGDAKWIKKGGEYYSECNVRLKG